MPVKRQLQLVVLVLMALACGIFLYEGHHITDHSQRLAKVYFYDKSEHRVTLDAFKGQVVLVNIWAPWCAPCVEELPSLARLQKRFEDRLRVVAIAMDDASPARLQVFLKTHQAGNLEIYRDTDHQLSLNWAFDGIPTSFLLDRDGQVVRHYEGSYDWDKGPQADDVAALVSAENRR